PELRKALEHVGSSKLTSLNFFGPNMQPDEIATWKRSINIFSDACGRLSKKKTGALIVFEKRTKIGEIAKTGTIIDAVASVELIGNIFFVNSPLHDGAMIVRGGKIYAAGCFLPLSENYTISNELGTRHRAALGMSETSDAIVVVVSEETGVITLAQNGRLVRNLTPEQLASKLRAEFIIEPSEEGQTKIPMWKNKSKNQMK
ncbi:MAG: DNA integrity scanning protein DisA nucleotide-binding domain protein, partial [Oscillospiraceae bacterium]